ncbi:MAG: SOS response-associated peptidase family protein [Oscillospiraceae bacterium]|nr:SOS response-associated peptidase family protein [Oscillospiraceae bacterium]
MCGRYIANSEDEIMEIREILKQISMRLVNKKAALSEIFPTDKVIILTNCQLSTVNYQLSKWGVEKWDGKGVIINAKSETYEQSRFFGSFAVNRCIIPAHGYYEWGKPNPSASQKTKYMFTSEDKHGIFMCGIYRPIAERDRQNLRVEALDFAIITKPADENISHIHPRMPLIIRPEQAEDWLSGRAGVSEMCRCEVIYEEAV